ncbi:MAG: gamma-glutamylcyclotransferase [Dehalococcoidia bacterium]|nr:MAG: gamma-glutamylcyclotransferase [Dehalococcoidia bacterium]
MSLYFAYGAALDRKHLARQCPECSPKVSATLSHHQLVFTGWSRVYRGATASLRPLRGAHVKGGVYDVPDSAIKKLNIAENFPTQNTKINILVNTESGESLNCFTYVPMHQAAEGKPAPEYLALLQQGYRDWGLI